MGIISSSRIPVAVATEIKKCNICSNELNLLEQICVCGNCNNSYHIYCYHNTSNNFNELNKYAGHTTCPNCRRVGYIYRDYYQ